MAWLLDYGNHTLVLFVAKINWLDQSDICFKSLVGSINLIELFIKWMTSKTLPSWVGAGVYLWLTMHWQWLHLMIPHVTRAQDIFYQPWS